MELRGSTKFRSLRIGPPLKKRCSFYYCKSLSLLKDLKGQESIPGSAG